MLRGICSAEKIVGGGAKQVARTAIGRFVGKSANDARRSAVQFAADQPGGGGQFVGNGFKAGVQSVAVRIAAAAIVAQRLHSGDADAEINQAFAPGTAERVGDENWDGE